MYIDWNNIIRQIEIAQRTLDSINYIDLEKAVNVSKIHQENRRLFEAWNSINANMTKNFEINIQNIVKIADLYNNTLKNINPNLLSISSYNAIIDTVKIFNQIETNILDNNLQIITNNLNYYKKDIGSEIDDFNEIEKLIINDPISADNIIYDIINKTLTISKKEKKILILGALFSFLLLIKDNGTFSGEILVHLDKLIDVVFGVLMGAIYDKI